MKTTILIAAALISVFALAVIVAAIRRAMRKRPSIQAELNEMQPDNLHRAFFGTEPEVTSHGLHSHQLDFYRSAINSGMTTPEAEALRDRFRTRHPNMTAAWEEAGLIRPEGKSGERIVGKSRAFGEPYGRSALEAQMDGRDLPAPWGFRPPLEDDEGEPLPGAMLAPPNIGGVDHPAYKGDNYASPEEVAEEMKTVIYFDKPDGEEWEGSPHPMYDPARYRKD